MRVEVLGPVRVRADELIAVERPAQRRLLSILALAGGSRLSTDALIDRFWPEEPPETARAAIQTHVSGLRKVLGDGVVATEGYGYRLDLDTHELDARQFDRLALEARDHAKAHAWETALDAIERGLELWRDDPFPELADEEFALPEIRRLAETRLELLETRAEALIALGRPEEALPGLEALTVSHPYRERLWEHLMTARYRVGRNAEALQAFQELSNHLAEIGAVPGVGVRRLEEKILLHDDSLANVRHNLPQELDTFIGRRRELDHLTQLVGASRVTGVLGAGGSGKTRMALHVARRLIPTYPDGVWLVGLADVDDTALVHPALAEAIGLPIGSSEVAEVIRRFFTQARSLLVLDNCEHLLGVCATVAGDLLRSAPDLTVLYTSREPMNLSGETRYVVPGMSLPGEIGPKAKADRSDSLRLFRERARQADPSFDVDADYETQSSICRRLDGMPLAIELAARRVSSLSLAEIDAGLAKSTALLAKGDPAAHPRHQTLDATIDWSYRLAPPAQQRALAAVSIFRGGFDLEMARWVLGDDAPRMISDLVDQSLVVTYRGARGRRYRLLETVRQFGLDRATDCGIAEETAQAHTRWSVDFASRTWEAWQKPGMDRVVEAVHEEFDNLNAAFEREERLGNRATAGKIAEGLVWHWHSLGYLSIALDLYERALDSCDDLDRRVALTSRKSSALFNTNQPAQAFEAAETAYRLQAELAPSEAKAYAVSMYAHIHAIRPEFDAAAGLPYAEEAVDVALATGNDLLVAVLRLDLALALAWAGEGARARSALEEAVIGVEDLGDPVTVAYTYTQAATIGQLVGELRRESLPEYANRLVRWLEAHPHIASRFRMGWVEWAMIQRGEFAEIEVSLERWSSEGHLEGFHKLGNLVPLATARWMQGRLDDALETIRECEAVGINPRWFHDFYPLKVDILVDLGRLDEAFDAAEEYLQFETDATESAMKLGVLNPLTRGVADLAGTLAESGVLCDRAESIVARMEEILAAHPPRTDGSVSMEVPATHLLFAKAEATRLVEPSPTAWRAAKDAADFLYFRLYAQIRLGEALRAAGDEIEGKRQLHDGLAESKRVGARRLVALAENLLSG